MKRYPAYFKKENRIASLLSKKGKRERRLQNGMILFVFVFGAFTMWEFLYQLCNMVGSIVSGAPAQAGVQLKRMFPIVLSAFIFVYLGIWLTCAYRAENDKKRAGKWIKNGCATIVLGVIALLYPIIGLITGEYEKLIEGNPSPLYPLDTAMGGIAAVLFGIYAVLNGKVFNKKGSGLVGSSLTHTACGGIAYTLSYMVALCSFAACLYATYTVDFTHGNIFFNIMLILNYFSAFLMAAVYRFVYLELKDEYKQKAKRDLGFAFLILNVILLALYLVSVQIENEAPNLNAYAVLPIDFTASFNAFLPIFALNNIIAPLTAWIKGLIRSKQKR